MSRKSKYIVVFDLDETLGHFTELGVFCDIIQNYNKSKLTFNEFYKIMDLFPEFLRPNILQILSYLKTKKQRKECYKVIIYTNNQGPKEWAQFIKKYFETKLNYKLFDQVIGAYKINGKKVEPERTSHDKSVEDLFQITDLPKDTKVCFLDDQYHYLMDYNNVYYINVKPYIITLPFSEIATRYYDHNSKFINNKELFIRNIISKMKDYNLKIKYSNHTDHNNQILSSKEILNHLHKFFKIFKKNYTKHNMQKLKNSKNITSKHKKFN